MSSLADLLGDLPQVKSQDDPFLAKFGFHRNPFPAARTIIEQVLYNQVEARNKFVGVVREVLVAEPQRRAMGIVGGTGGGKTHFLRHCQYLMRSYRSSDTAPFVVVEVLAGSSSAIHVLREVLREADEAAKVSGEYDLLTALIRGADSEDDFDSARQNELRGVLQLLFQSQQEGFVPPDRDGRMEFEPLRDLAKKWLAGAALSNTEKRYLAVFSRLSSAAMMTRLISELLTIARQRNIIRGVLLCIDEIETLFSGSVSSARIQGFLQDIRYFFDEAVRNDEGYSLLVLSAATQLGASRMREYNYPLYQRLGFDDASRAELVPIANMKEVREIADLYVKHEIGRAGLPKKTYPDVLSEDELEQAFRSAAGQERSQQATPAQRVNQGQLLQAMHLLVEGKRAEAKA